MGTAVIVEAVRTPVGKRGGVLSGVHAAEILGGAQTALIDRAGIAPAEVEQVAGGCVTQAGEQSNNVTRTAWLHAGLPLADNGLPTTLDAQCGSAQQAAHLVAGLIAADAIGVGIACGVEAMSRVPLGTAARADAGTPRPGSWNIDMPSQYVAAERLSRSAARLSRADTDAFGLRSQTLAAGEPGRTGVSTVRWCRSRWVPTCVSRPWTEGLRETSLEALARLKPVVEGGLHTAGSSSQISDGAAAVLLADADRARQFPGAAAAGPDPGPSASSAPTRTTTWTARSRRPSGCWSAAAWPSATSTCSRSTRRSRRSCCPGWRCTGPTRTG